MTPMHALACWLSYRSSTLGLLGTAAVLACMAVYLVWHIPQTKRSMILHGAVFRQRFLCSHPFVLPLPCPVLVSRTHPLSKAHCCTIVSLPSRPLIQACWLRALRIFCLLLSPPPPLPALSPALDSPASFSIFLGLDDGMCVRTVPLDSRVPHLSLLSF